MSDVKRISSITTIRKAGVANSDRHVCRVCGHNGCTESCPHGCSLSYFEGRATIIKAVPVLDGKFQVFANRGRRVTWARLLGSVNGDGFLAGGFVTWYPFRKRRQVAYHDKRPWIVVSRGWTFEEEWLSALSMNEILRRLDIIGDLRTPQIGRLNSDELRLFDEDLVRVAEVSNAEHHDNWSFWHEAFTVRQAMELLNRCRSPAA